MIADALQRLFDLLKEHRGTRLLCLATTANINNPAVLVGSPRISGEVLAGNLILRETNSFHDFVQKFDSVVDCFFVDCERKSGVSLVERARSIIHPDRLHFFKPNDFTVEAADEWIAGRITDLTRTRSAIIGAGNIGSKLALRLAERGSDVNLVGKNPKVLQEVAQGLSHIVRGEGTITPCVSILDACKDANVIVGCTQGLPVIDEDAISVSAPSILLDVGNGCFSSSAISAAQRNQLMIEVLSPAAGWEGALHRYITTRELQRGMGRRKLRDSEVWIVSRGILGHEGDVLVDSISNPTHVIGVCNGSGDLLYGEDAEIKTKIAETSLGLI
ncbi:hypothetical protein C9975_01740 [Thalassospira xiamenensis]|nr:hypothetical protein C9975_01740 [Thalassospira xiamenensis]